MHELALAFAVASSCALAAHPRRGRLPELTASVLMLVAMIDAAAPGPLLSPIAWTAVLLGSALLLAIAGRTRRGSCAAHSTAHTGVCSVIMAGLIVAGHGHTATAATAHAHGGQVPFEALVSIGVVAFVLASVYGVARSRRVLDRIQIGAMAVSTTLMLLATVGPSTSA